MNEALKAIQTLKQLTLCGNCATGADKEGGCTACDRMIAKYQAIKALEKQISKKVITELMTDYNECVRGPSYEIYKCPDCMKHIYDIGAEFCGSCGKSLDWGDSDE
ncbi:hypothetical protein CLHUN_01790 [Ruminiclostridium hungatei]|uniref:Uncharacterized protein n=1 Tax=Ruminiclostridium hungatei TaxID=48256 RepID=A0A1V4SRE8_RUMHU|nr:hypothetical protein [Ruminiclostridium hungatei]OPX46363.1 hypothetical protein CLHUN_01790 [Ruminiclostridium hungatei]